MVAKHTAGAQVEWVRDLGVGSPAGRSGSWHPSRSSVAGWLGAYYSPTRGPPTHTPHTYTPTPPPAAPRRLVALAKQHGKGHEANALLFRMSYEEGANISSRAALLEAGERLGLPGVAEYLDGDGGLAEVQEDNSFGKRE